jgi:hypothetical protein
MSAALVGLGAASGLAGASGYKITVSPKRVAPGGKVTVFTTPRMHCSITLTIAGKHFSHNMPYGWVQIKMPRRDVPGRVPVRVSCAGSRVTGSFTVAR